MNFHPKNINKLDVDEDTIKMSSIKLNTTVLGECKHGVNLLIVCIYRRISTIRSGKVYVSLTYFHLLLHRQVDPTK